MSERKIEIEPVKGEYLLYHNALAESDPSEAGDLFVQTYRSVMAMSS